MTVLALVIGAVIAVTLCWLVSFVHDIHVLLHREREAIDRLRVSIDELVEELTSEE